MNRVREWRDYRAYSLDELAERSGLHRDTILKIEHGKRKKPHGKTLRKLARALDCEPADLKAA